MMHTAAYSFLVALLLVVGSNAGTSPSSECWYFSHYFFHGPYIPSLVPSVNTKCVAEYNSVANKSALCAVAECQSLYSVLSQCTSPSFADAFFSSECGQYGNSYCTDLQDDDLVQAVSSACNNGTYCSPSCLSAIAALEQFSGCCEAYVLNGPKVLCGQQPIAPCSTLLNSGSVAAPSSECSYFTYIIQQGYLSASTFSASLLPSLSAVCLTAWANANAYGKGSINAMCIPECKSFYALFDSCSYSGVSVKDIIKDGAGTGLGNMFGSYYLAAYHCGKFKNQTCLSLESHSSSVHDACSNSIYCSSSCLNAITDLEQNGGCCSAYVLNGPKVLCGQQPIAPCSTLVNSGSEVIGISVLFVILFVAVHCAAW